MNKTQQELLKITGDGFGKQVGGEELYLKPKPAEEYGERDQCHHHLGVPIVVLDNVHIHVRDEAYANDRVEHDVDEGVSRWRMLLQRGGALWVWGLAEKGLRVQGKKVDLEDGLGFRRMAMRKLRSFVAVVVATMGFEFEF